MTIDEVSKIIGVIGGLSGMSLGLYSVLTTRRLRREGTDEELREALVALDRRLVSLELQLSPLFKAMAERLSSMFHQPDPEAWELDRLIEQFDTDETALKWSLREEALDRLLEGIERKRGEMQQQPGGMDTSIDVWSTLAVERLRGIRDARMALRQRDQVEHAHQEALLEYLQSAREAEPVWEWGRRVWSCLTRFLRGFRSS